MVEIILTVWLISLVLSLSLVIWKFIHTRRQINSKKSYVLNQNLQKVGLCWLPSQSNFGLWGPGVVERENFKALRGVALFGLLSFAGLVGFLLIFVVFMSMHFLVKDRKAAAVFSSDLVSVENLGSEEIQSLVNRINEIS